MLTSDECFCDQNRPIVLNPENPLNVNIKDYSRPFYQDADEKDFEIRTIAEEQLIDDAFEFGGRETMEENLYNYGDEDDLPEIDRTEKQSRLRKNME